MKTNQILTDTTTIMLPWLHDYKCDVRVMNVILLLFWCVF